MPHSRYIQKRTAGLAFLETIMMLPAFVLGLWGCVWLHDLYAARHVANHQARACALAWAAQGCDGTAPPACLPSSAFGDAPEAIIPDEVAVGGLAGPAQRTRVAESLARVPVLGSQLDRLERFEGNVGRSDDHTVTTPPLLGTRTDTLNSHSYALCAPRPRSGPALSQRDVFCGTMPCGFPGCEAAQADPTIGCISGP